MAVTSRNQPCPCGSGKNTNIVAPTNRRMRAPSDHKRHL
ncbi:MAG: SEC-C domain-containing protein [Thiobacillus sp.]|nr:MAG: SEC-C domain-containing protein [Thiobacillus sp.]